MTEQMSITEKSPLVSPNTARLLAVISARRISEREQKRLYEAEMRGEKPKLSDRPYS